MVEVLQAIVILTVAVSVPEVRRALRAGRARISAPAEPRVNTDTLKPEMVEDSAVS